MSAQEKGLPKGTGGGEETMMIENKKFLWDTKKYRGLE